MCNFDTLATFAMESYALSKDSRVLRPAPPLAPFLHGTGAIAFKPPNNPDFTRWRARPSSLSKYSGEDLKEALKEPLVVLNRRMFAPPNRSAELFETILRLASETSCHRRPPRSGSTRTAVNLTP